MKEGFEGLIDHLVSGGFFLGEAVEILEKGMLESALAKTKNNQSEASKVLGIHRNTLQRKMVQYQIDGKHPRRKPQARAGTSRGKPAQTTTRNSRRARKAS